MEEYTLSLKKRQFEYLVAMANKHGLPDESKALRCLINYALEEHDQENAIFEQVRCLDFE